MKSYKNHFDSPVSLSILCYEIADCYEFQIGTTSGVKGVIQKEFLSESNAKMSQGK